MGNADDFSYENVFGWWWNKSIKQTVNNNVWSSWLLSDEWIKIFHCLRSKLSSPPIFSSSCSSSSFSETRTINPVRPKATKGDGRPGKGVAMRSKQASPSCKECTTAKETQRTTFIFFFDRRESVSSDHDRSSKDENRQLFANPSMLMISLPFGFKTNRHAWSLKRILIDVSVLKVFQSYDIPAPLA